MKRSKINEEDDENQVPEEEKALKLIFEVSKNKEEIKKEFNINDIESEDEHDIESFIKRAQKYERKEIERIEPSSQEWLKPKLIKPMPTRPPQLSFPPFQGGLFLSRERSNPFE